MEKIIFIIYNFYCQNGKVITFLNPVRKIKQDLDMKNRRLYVRKKRHGS
jgi:hypothetical protein